MIKRLNHSQAFSKSMDTKEMQKIALDSFKKRLINDISNYEFEFVINEQDDSITYSIDLLLLDKKDCRKLKVDTRKF